MSTNSTWLHSTLCCCFFLFSCQFSTCIPLVLFPPNIRFPRWRYNKKENQQSKHTSSIQFPTTYCPDFQFLFLSKKYSMNCLLLVFPSSSSRFLYSLTITHKLLSSKELTKCTRRLWFLTPRINSQKKLARLHFLLFHSAPLSISFRVASPTFFKQKCFSTLSVLDKQQLAICYEQSAPYQSRIISENHDCKRRYSTWKTEVSWSTHQYFMEKSHFRVFRNIPSLFYWSFNRFPIPCWRRKDNRMDWSQYRMGICNYVCSYGNS